MTERNLYSDLYVSQGYTPVKIEPLRNKREILLCLGEAAVGKIEKRIGGHLTGKGCSVRIIVRGINPSISGLVVWSILKGAMTGWQAP